MKPNSELERSVTGSMLERLLTYDPESGIFRMAMGRGGIKKGSRAGYIRPDGYIQIKINCRQFLAHRLAWVWMYGKWPDGDADIDHINRDRSDNRISNLRVAMRAQNSANGSTKINNTSGFPGVVWKVRKDGRGPRWFAYINVKGRRVNLGHFKTKEEAIQARMAGEKRIHGEFAPERA